MKSVSKRALALLCAVVMLVGVIPFAASVSAATSYVYEEDFQAYDNGEIPDGWSVYNADGDGYCWEIERQYNGDVAIVSNSLGTLNADEYLMMPAVTIPSNVESSYYLTFDHRNTYPFGGGSKDAITIYASKTPITDPSLLTEDQIVYDDAYYPGSVEWSTVTVDLAKYKGDTWYFAFRHRASKIWQFDMDNVAITCEEADRFPVRFDLAEDIVSVVPQNGAFEVIDGQDYAFSLAFNEKINTANGTLTVTANGKELTAVDGVYTLPAVTEKQKVSVDFRYTVGDINGNGTVDLGDATQLFYYVNGLKEFNSVELAAANIDTFADLNSNDMAALFYYIAGLRAYVNENRDLTLLWKNTYADSKNGFLQAGTIESADYYLDRRLVLDHSAAAANRDAKVIFKRNGKSRIVNLSDGYAFSLPFADFKTDYSLSALRSTYESDTFVLNVSEETGNPYGNNQKGWDTYSSEWLLQCIADDSFLSKNNLERSHAKVEGSTTVLSGYTVWRYDIHIKDAQDIAMPYYSIAVIRKTDEFVKFHLMVMKSTTDQASAMNTAVKSFKEITPVGISQNEQAPFECEPDPNWNDETAAYYEKLMTQSTTDWGIFTESMSDTNDSASNLRQEYAELSQALDFEYDIMPTYTHIGWGNTMHYFPTNTAAEFAGGNGFNGKPVLQFTYQFTTNNNGNVKASATPMFDVARGVYDEHFRELARDIKAYGKPVLFRLNNEMNTDWTSYCGMVTLLDPDFFTITWERLYDIFEQEGVDNCIWIFNPVATSTPYCSWGEDLCYLPDLDTVHALGLTAYEMGNGSTLKSFESLYRELYEKNSPYFDNYPQIISEFAAGAGGEKQYDYSRGVYVDTVLGRNAQKQAAWVEAMFECLSRRNEPGYEFCRNIKGAVWFCVNDYATVDNKDYIVNYLEIHDASIEAFKNGLALHP